MERGKSYGIRVWPPTANAGCDSVLCSTAIYARPACENLHICPALLIGNHCHAANCQLPAHRIGSNPNTTDSRFCPARSRYPDYPLEIAESVGRGKVSDFKIDFSNHSWIFQVSTSQRIDIDAKINARDLIFKSQFKRHVCNYFFPLLYRFPRESKF